MIEPEPKPDFFGWLGEPRFTVNELYEAFRQRLVDELG